jgi:hypothetical protein
VNTDKERQREKIERRNREKGIVAERKKEKLTSRKMNRHRYKH